MRWSSLRAAGLTTCVVTLGACSTSTPDTVEVTQLTTTTEAVCCVNAVDEQGTTTIAAVGEYGRLYQQASSVVFAEVTVKDSGHAVVRSVQEDYGKAPLPDGSVLVSGEGWSFPEWDGSLYMLLFVRALDDGSFQILNDGDPAHYDVAQLQREVPEALPAG